MARLRFVLCCILFVFAAPSFAKEPLPKPAGVGIGFGGVQYLHRWSKGGQNEFTPAGQEDLGKWRDMVTLNVHAKVRTGDQLAGLANAVLGNYQGAGGRIVRTDSKPRTPQKEAEHLIVALLSAPGVLEAAFARVVMVDGQGMVVVYSHRAYGPQAGATIGKWLEANGQKVETQLMGWNGYMHPAPLAKLPQSAM
jgi:hypothetical protein